MMHVSAGTSILLSQPRLGLIPVHVPKADTPVWGVLQQKARCFYDTRGMWGSQSATFTLASAWFTLPISNWQDAILRATWV